jgi:phosphoglycolate phosphatase
MADERHRLVLWDIDHTLIETRGVGTRLYIAAFEAVTGRTIEHTVEPTGRTETAIFSEALERHGIEATDELHRHYAVELARQYERHVELLQQEGRALPGAAAALAALAVRPGMVQTVLSGNLRAVAITKLRVFGLAAHIDFAVGAYGDDASKRARLVSIAQARAGAKHAAQFTRTSTVIVGDTASDVRAAHEGGASIVAVASGKDSADDLRRAGAEVVLSDLTDTGRVTEAVCTVW